MAALVRSADWSRTPLGPIAGWPQSLRTTVSLCLASNFPINIIWGPDYIQIYNDGYRVVCGDVHPSALGQAYNVTWASAWPAVGEPFHRARAGVTSYLENQRMFLTRNGYLEETFFTFSLSPIRDETGGVGGVFHPVTETTAVMLAERRTRALRDLTAALGETTEQSQFAARTIDVLSGYDFDLPFALFYQLDPSAGRYRLRARHGVDPGSPLAPAELDPAATEPWSIAAAIGQSGVVEQGGVAARAGAAACGPYPEPPARAFLLPVPLPGQTIAPIVLVLGVSPRLPLDEAYRGHHELLLAAVSAGLARVRALEGERRRAEALAELDRAKTTFFSNVSHEFRTPLTLMLGPVEDILEQAATLAPAQRQNLEVVHRNALRLLRLVNTLLDFARIEAGRVRARLEPTDLRAVTAELAANFESACARAGLALTVDCQALSRPVHVDRDMWEKIVLNLLSNAFKFTLAGGIAVSLRETEAGVELAVRDTGVGIAAAELPRVFERFHRIEGQRGRTHEGTGIGLSLIQELVSLHGGDLTAESVEGEGSVFRVRIPFGQAPATPVAAADAALASTAMPARAFVEEALRWLPGAPDAAAATHSERPRPVEGQARIVVADDNADMRAYVRRILEGGGYVVEAVENGIAALAAVRRQPPPDLLLSDVMMPVLDGFGLLREIRADPALEGLLFILLSARAGEEAKLEGLAAGADDYLLKPFGGRELLARIDGAIRLARQRQEAASREQDLQTRLATASTQAALRASEERLDLAMAAGQLGSWSLDLASGRFLASDISLDNLGWPREQPYTHATVLDRMLPEDQARRDICVARAIEQHSVLDIEVRIRRPDGALGWVLIRGRANYDGDGVATGLAGVTLDITERKRAEERQEALLAELNHRVKNTLAVVQSIAMQTRRYAADPALFDTAFASRIGALARAHDLLTSKAWEGAMLSEVVEQTMAMHRLPVNATDRVTCSGPIVHLRPNAAVTLHMAFHELATNAIKFGALSVDRGGIRIDWALDGSTVGAAVAITWTEHDGPPVTPPGRTGFGSRLIRIGVPRELGGSVEMDFAPTGLVCRMRLTDASRPAGAA